MLLMLMQKRCFYCPPAEAENSLPYSLNSAPLCSLMGFCLHPSNKVHQKGPKQQKSSTVHRTCQQLSQKRALQSGIRTSQKIATECWGKWMEKLQMGLRFMCQKNSSAVNVTPYPSTNKTTFAKEHRNYWICKEHSGPAALLSLWMEVPQQAKLSR